MTGEAGQIIGVCGVCGCVGGGSQGDWHTQSLPLPSSHSRSPACAACNLSPKPCPPPSQPQPLVPPRVEAITLAYLPPGDADLAREAHNLLMPSQLAYPSGVSRGCLIGFGDLLVSQLYIKGLRCINKVGCFRFNSTVGQGLVLCVCGGGG